MRTRSRRLGGLIAIAAATVLVFSACAKNSEDSGGKTGDQSSAGFADCDQNPNTCNSGKTKPGGQLTLAMEKAIPNWNIFDLEGNTYETAQVVAGALSPTPFTVYPDATVHLNKDLMVDAQMTKTDPQTVVYKIRPEAVWSDGTPISAKDFQMFWRMNNGKDCSPKVCVVASATGYDVIKSVEGSDNDKTVTVTFASHYPDWQSLFQLYPSSVAAKAGDLSTPAGLAKAYNAFKTDTPTWSGGPYIISDYKKDESVTLTKNPKWYGATQPSLDKVVYKVITDQAQETPALKNREIDAMTPQPSGDIVDAVRGIPSVNFNLAKGPTWEHIDLNLKNKFLADMPLRQAIFTAINRQAIIDKTVGPFFKGAQTLNNHNFMPGMPGYKDVVTPTGQGKGDAEAAKKILTDAGYQIKGDKLYTKAGEAVPTLNFRYTTGNTLRQNSGEIVQNELKAIGLDVKLDPTQDLGATLGKGDFDMIIFAWVGTPFPTQQRDLWGTKGGSNYGKWSNPQADQLMDQAAQELDAAKMRDLFNQADDIMSKEAYVLPLYQKPVMIAIYNDYINIRNNPTSAGPSYNMSEWGLKAQ